LVVEEKLVLPAEMSQAKVTEYFRGCKRNHFQPSKRQKIEIDSVNSDVRGHGTLCVSKVLGTKKTSRSVVQTKLTATCARSMKHNTRSRIPESKDIRESHRVQLDDIWPKSCDTKLNSRLTSDVDHTPTKLRQNTSSKQNLNVTENRNGVSGDEQDVSLTAPKTTSAVGSGKLYLLQSKRGVHYDEDEEDETSTVSEVATAVIDDHGNSHPCTPSKHRTLKPGIESNKRTRCLVPTDSNNYYKTPQKFDFSPYQSDTSIQQLSSSARKKLVLSNVDGTESPPVFVFKGSAEESPVALQLKENSLFGVQRKATDAMVKSSDKAQQEQSVNHAIAKDAVSAGETVAVETECKEAKSASRKPNSVVKIGTCRNLEQLKRRLQDLSPHKVKPSGSDSLSDSKRYIIYL